MSTDDWVWVVATLLGAAISQAFAMGSLHNYYRNEPWDSTDWRFRSVGLSLAALFIAACCGFFLAGALKTP